MLMAMDEVLHIQIDELDWTEGMALFVQGEVTMADGTVAFSAARSLLPTDRWRLSFQKKRHAVVKTPTSPTDDEEMLWQRHERENALETWAVYDAEANRDEIAALLDRELDIATMTTRGNDP